MITVTHSPTGKKKEFLSPRSAAEFYQQCIDGGLKKETLVVDNPTGVSFSIYTDRIPRHAQELIETLEREYGAHVPLWHFIVKPHTRFSSGHCYWTKNTGKLLRIAVSRGTDYDDFIGSVLHEYAHALTIFEHHNRTFYRTLFGLWRRFLSMEHETKQFKREYEYKKNSRYWYAEYHGIESILAEYRQVQVAARKKTAAEKQSELIGRLF